MRSPPETNRSNESAKPRDFHNEIDTEKDDIERNILPFL